MSYDPRITNVPRTVKLTSDLSAVTSTTLTDSTGLSFSVSNGQYYWFQFYVLFQSASMTASLKVGMTTPTFTMMGANITIPDTVSTRLLGAIVASGDSASASTVTATGVTYLAVIEGTILPSADGTLQVQHARGGITSANITIKQGSCGVCVTL